MTRINLKLLCLHIIAGLIIQGTAAFHPQLQAFSGDSAPGTLNMNSPITILFFGDSITAGYGLDIDDAFPALIQQKADSLGYDIETVNAGVSGETSAGGLRRLDWVLQRDIDIFVLELGGNDGLRGIDPENTRQNLQAIIDKVAKINPSARIVLTGMEAPPNMGESYTRQFRDVYRDLSISNEVVFMPFILEGVAGDPDLNQADGIHPTTEGHSIIASHLWEILEPLLNK